MQLTARLEAVKNAVLPCEAVLDAGTDHAYVPIALVQQGICRRAIASDINRGPLLRAREHIQKSGLDGKIETRLGSGITVINPGEAQSVILAGMGGVLIAQLLEEDKAVSASVKQFVLQPMNAPEYLRHSLHKNHFCITEEYLAEEGDKLYVILCAKHGEESYEKECYYHIGKRLFQRYGEQEIFLRYLKKKTAAFRKMLSGQQKALQRNEKRIAYLENLLRELEGLGYDL